MDKLSELAERLEKRAERAREYAENARLVANLLTPEFDKFEAREGVWNTYAVRMAVDHQQSMKRDLEFAEDLEQAAAALRARATTTHRIGG